MSLLLSYLLAVNLLTFALFGIDKRRARRGSWRIRERSLFLASAAGGSLCAWIAMQTFRHKTKNLSFRLGIPAMLVAQTALLFYFFFGLNLT